MRTIFCSIANSEAREVTPPSPPLENTGSVMRCWVDGLVAREDTTFRALLYNSTCLQISMYIMDEIGDHILMKYLIQMFKKIFFAKYAENKFTDLPESTGGQCWQ